jgi:serine/threonine protein kinase
MSNLDAEAKRIFYESLDYPPGEREAFLDRACRDNRELRQRTDALLKAYEAPVSFLDNPVLDRPDPGTSKLVTDSTAEDRTALNETGSSSTAKAHFPEGERYRVLRPHARGGLGEVFVAEDRELRREVALKEIRAENARDHDLRRRFLLEGEVTGHLEHPGIVPIYGAGCRADGRPFYAMRFIRGETLESAVRRLHGGDGPDQTAGERAVTFRQLLSRFVAVCQAMAYAHSKGVIHRDLKPSNVMLGPYGETLIVDWGLAKVLDNQEDTETREAPFRPGDGSGSATRAGSAMGTPAYMSPEQAAGRQDLGPSSDTYSLGATFYVLLTGRPPFEGDLDEVLRDVQRGKFSRPRQVKADVPPALEAVCLKAMAHDPGKRYASPLDLARDVENWLADEPIAAWREPLKARAGRWVRKHKRLTAVAVTLTFVALIGATAGGLWYQKTEAVRQARQAHLAEGMTEALDRVEGETEALSQTLADVRSAQRFIADLNEWRQQVRSARSAWERAELIAASSQEPLDDSLRERLTALDERVREHERHWEVADRLDRIRLNAVEVDGDGPIHVEKASGEYAQLFQDVLQVDIRRQDPEQIARRIRASPFRHVLVAALDHWTMSSRMNDSQDKDLLPILLEVARKADPDPWRDRFRQMDTWKNADRVKALAAEVDISAQFPHTLELLAFKLRKPERIALLKRAILAYPGDFWLNFNLSRVCDDPKEKAAYLQAALAIRPSTVVVWNNLGSTLQQQGNVAGAMEAYRKAIDIDPDGAAIAYFNLGTIYMYQSRWHIVVETYRKGLKLFPRQVAVQTNLATALRELGRHKEAIQEYQKAIAINPRHANAHTGLGQVYLREGRYADAVVALAKAHSLLPKSHPDANFVREHLTQARAHLALVNEQAEEIRLRQGQTEVAGQLTKAGSTEASPPNQGSPRKVYQIHLESGTHYQIDVRGDFDTCLRIENEKQWCLRFNDNVNPSAPRHSRVVFTPRETRSYRTVVASRKPGLTGSFTLAIEPVTEQGEPIVRQVKPPIDTTGKRPVMEISLHLEAGQSWSFEVEGEAAPRFTQLHTADGKTIVQPEVIGPRTLGTTSIDLTPTKAGEYVFFVVSQANSHAHQYTFRANRYDPGAVGTSR